jgi:hypothetical protein
MKSVSPRKAFQPEILSGWKDIATYLGKGVRTVQRYERELSLPVRRPAGKSAASVIATKAELDGWIAAAPVRREFQLWGGSSTIGTRGALNELNRQVEELRRLRQASIEIRLALHESVLLLQRNLLRFSLTEEASSERRIVADELSFPSKKVQ